MPRRRARTGGDGRSEVPGLALLPHPLAKSRTGGGVWGAWKGAGCWKGPEYSPRVTLDPSVGAAVVGGLEEWQRGTGRRTNIAPAQAALPSPSLPQIPGVSPHTWVGVRGSQERARGGSCRTTGALLLHSQAGHVPLLSPKEQGGNPRAQPNPASRTTGQGGMGAWGQEGAP